MIKRIERLYFKLFNKIFTLEVYNDKTIWYNNPMYFKKLKKFFGKHFGLKYYS